MAEAVALTASIAGLASLAIQLTQISYHFISDLRDAPKAVASYIRELSALTSVLMRLQEVLDNPDATNLLSSRPSSLSKESMDIYMNELTGVKINLEKRASKQGFLAKLRGLTWPLEEKETRKFVDTLHRIHGLLNSALSSDIFILSVANFEEVKSLRRDNVHRDILDWLSPRGENKSMLEIFTTLHPGTGQWLLEEKAYLKWTTGGDKLLWCYGDPGTGKSVLASLVVHQLNEKYTADDVVVISYFCDYQNQKSQTTENILRNLIKQVAERKKVFPPSIVSLHQNFMSSHQIPAVPTLVKTLVELCGDFSSIFLVMDGLDELLHRAKIIPVLRSLPKSGVRLLLTSRPLPDIQEAFKLEPQIEIRATDIDVREYIETRFQESGDLAELTTKALRESFKDTIVERADGMFLLVRMVMEHLTTLTTIKEIRSALKTMPSDLSVLFEKTMVRINQQSPNRAKLAKRALEWVSNAKRPLTVEELRHALAVEECSTEMDPENLCLSKVILSVCLGLLIADNQNTTVRLVHFTAQEFLFHHWNIDEAQISLSTTCLTYLSFDAFKSGECEDFHALRARISEMPLLAYAANFWGEHVREVEAEIQERVIELCRSKNLMAAAFQVMNFRPNMSLFKSTLQSASVSPPISSLPLNIAAYWGLVNTAKLLLNDENFDEHISLPDNSGWTPLHWASSNGHQTMVELLASKRANLEVQDTQGWTPLFWATLKHHYEIVSFLLACKANILHRDRSEWTALHWATNKGDNRMIQLLLDHKADPLLYLKDETITLRNMTLDRAKRILQERHASNKHALVDAQSPLEIAAQHGDHAAFELLVRSVLEDKVNTPENSFNRSSNMFWRRNVDTAYLWEALEKREKIFYTSVLCAPGTLQSETFPLKLLDQAIKDEQLEVVRLLVEDGVSLGSNGYQHEKRRTPLHAAAYCKNSDIPELLIQHGADTCAGYNEVVEDGNWHDRSTPLHLAAISGYPSTVEVLARDGRAVKMKDSVGCTPLHKVWRNDRRFHNDLTSLEVAKILINHGADIHAIDSGGNTPLHHAVCIASSATIEMLLSHGALVQSPNLVGETSLHAMAVRVYLSSYQRLECGESDEVEAEMCDLLLAHSEDSSIDLKTGTKSKYGADRTALEIALNGSNWSIAASLHERGGTVSDSFDLLGPLHTAVVEGELAIVKVLISLGANVTQSILPPRSGREARWEDLEMSPHLRYGRGWTKEEQGMPLLIKAIYNYSRQPQHPSVSGRSMDFKGDFEMNRIPTHQYTALIGLLIAAGVDVYATDSTGKNALHISARSVYSDRIAELLLRSGTDVNAKDERGYTPLHEAAESGSANLVRLLLRYRAFPLYKTVNGLCPIDLATRSGDEEVVRVLIEDRGVPVSDRPVDYLQTVRFVNALQAHDIEDAKIYLSTLLDINLEYSDGRSLLHKAAEASSTDIATWLLEQGLDIEKPDSNGWTPLHVAAYSGHIFVVNTLITQGANISATTTLALPKPTRSYQENTCLTPLHLAASKGHEQICRVLLDHGADLEAGDGHHLGRTALAVAAYDLQMDVVKFLVGRGAIVGEIGAKLTPEKIVGFEGYEDVWRLLQEGSPDCPYGWR